MTDQERKAMEMALDALEEKFTSGNSIPVERATITAEEYQALRQALAQDKQEPVAYLDAVDNKTVYVAPNRKSWLDPHEDKEWLQFHYDHCHDTPLYTAPPSMPCEITDLLQQKFQSGNNVPVERVTITRSEYEAALRSKNNG